MERDAALRSESMSGCAQGTQEAWRRAGQKISSSKHESDKKRGVQSALDFGFGL